MIEKQRLRLPQKEGEEGESERYLNHTRHEPERKRVRSSMWRTKVKQSFRRRKVKGGNLIIELVEYSVFKNYNSIVLSLLAEILPKLIQNKIYIWIIYMCLDEI